MYLALKILIAKLHSALVPYTLQTWYMLFPPQLPRLPGVYMGPGHFLEMESL